MKNQLINFLTRCRLSWLNSQAPTALVQAELSAGEVKDNLEYIEPYGFTSAPLSGAKGLALFLGGDRSHGVIINLSDQRYRPQDAKPGEVIIYTHEGASIHLKAGRVIEFDCDVLKINTKHYEVNADEINLDANKINIDAPEVMMSGTVNAPEVKIGSQTLSNHRHREHDGELTSEPL